MREKELISLAFRAAQYRDRQSRLLVRTVDVIKEARKLSSQELCGDYVHDHVMMWESGWVVIEEGQHNYNVYIKAHNY